MIAAISAWNTGHPVSRTRFCPRPMISPSLTITAPNGPPQPFSTDSIASRVASSMNLRSIAITPVCVVPSRHATIARVYGRKNALSRGSRRAARRQALPLSSCDARGGAMWTSRREFVKGATASAIALSLSRLALAEEPGFAARETLPRRQAWNPAATGVGRIDGVPKVTGAKLYASDFRAADLPGWSGKYLACHAHSSGGRDARLRRPRPLAPERRVEALGRGDRRRSRANRHARSRILCRRPSLPGRQDAALSRAAGGVVDL